jgi:hypothetical protein
LNWRGFVDRKLSPGDVEITVSGYTFVVDEEGKRLYENEGPWYATDGNLVSRVRVRRARDAVDFHRELALAEGIVRFKNKDRYDLRKSNLVVVPPMRAIITPSQEGDPPGSCRVIIRGHSVLIDFADLPLVVSGAPWFVCNNPRGVYFVSRKVLGKRNLLHRAILRAPKYAPVDHVDRDTLNNTRGNLRVVTVSENAHNSKLGARNKSGYKGVHQEGNSWIASFMVCRKEHKRGPFKTKEEAIEARKELVSLFGGSLILGETQRE